MGLNNKNLIKSKLLLLLIDYKTRLYRWSQPQSQRGKG